MKSFIKTLSLGMILFIFPVFCWAETTLPLALDGQSIFFHILGKKTKENPNANLSYVMDFSANSYKYQIIGTDKIIQGISYTYTIKDGKGVIDLHEVFNDTPTHYQIILTPQTHATGEYKYIQTSGGTSPNKRENIGSYTLLFLPKKKIRELFACCALFEI